MRNHSLTHIDQETPSLLPIKMLPAAPITSTDASDAHMHRLAASSSSSNAVAGACSCTQLFFPPPPPLTMDDSPPDSPSMPWRPGSSAYPPPAPIVFSSPEDLFQLHLQQSKQELQKLYDALSDATYDLSLRDIVQPPFSIDGSSAGSMDFLQAETEPTSELLPISPSEKCKGKPCNQNQVYQTRSHSCRKYDNSKCARPLSPKRKLTFSFSYPQRAMVYGRSFASQALHPQSIPSPAHEKSLGISSLPKLEHVLATPHELPALPSQRAPHHDAPLSAPSNKRPSFKRSYISAGHPTSASKLNNVHTERSEHNLRGAFSVAGSSNRVHPSSQCSSCASYTIFFKSRCMVCGKLYCSNCAKDEMDSVSDGRRCKSTCNSRRRLGSKRFSRSVRSKCWPLCCSNVNVSNRTQVIASPVANHKGKELVFVGVSTMNAV